MAKGDHLYVDRGLGSFTHHGIDCGDGTVIHYKDGQSILRSTRAFFSGGRPIQVRYYAQADPADVVLKRAMSRLGERDYHLVFNNCEHFATWCKTGQHHSQQVNQAMAASVVGGVIGGMAVNPLLAAPALAAAGLYGFSQFQQQIQQAERTGDPQVAQEYLRQAFAELEQVKRSLEPQLDRVLREAYKWHCTAQLAIKRQQEDLAKAALLKKYPLKQEALQLQAQLDEVRQLEAQLQQLLQRL
ncbi:MAG: lecithin retinol acyltransferase family protein [Prochlorotrichaceae cyanobacterium]|jgi:hypothetical protein